MSLIQRKETQSFPSRWSQRKPAKIDCNIYLRSLDKFSKQSKVILFNWAETIHFITFLRSHPTPDPHYKNPSGFDGQIVGKNNNFGNIFQENIIRESVQNIIFLFKLNFYCQ